MYFYWFFHWLNNFQKHQIALDASSHCVNWLSANNLASWLDLVAATATRQSSVAVVPHTKLELKTYFYGLSCFYISKKGKTLLNITSNLQLHVPCFWKHYNIFVVWVVESLHHLHCTDSFLLCTQSRKNFSILRCTMWMFQPMIDLVSQWAILPVE